MVPCLYPPHHSGFAGETLSGALPLPATGALPARSQIPHTFWRTPSLAPTSRGFAGEITAAQVLDSLNDGAVLVDIRTEVRELSVDGDRSEQNNIVG